MNCLNNPEIQKRIREAFNDPYLNALHNAWANRSNHSYEMTKEEEVAYSQRIEDHAAELGKYLCEAIDETFQDGVLKINE